MSPGTWRACIVALAAVLVPGCATEELHRDGMLAIAEGHFEEGLGKLEEAAKADPHNMTYRLDLKTQRDQVALHLLSQADAARAAGRYDEAEGLYNRALELAGNNSRVLRSLEAVKADRRHSEAVQRADAAFKAGQIDQAEYVLRGVLSEDPGFGSALALRARIDQARGPVAVVPRLKARDNRPVTLQFRDANTKMVFEVLSRQTGINFIFDKDVRSDSKTTIFVQQVPIEQAIELVLGQNQLSRQVLSENLVMIYPNTAQKQKDYQDQIVKTIYLTNADPKQAQNLLKTVLNAKTLFIDERSNQIVIRDTPEAVRMAEKLLASLDLPEPEVMMEVEVLEITRSRLQELGISYPTGTTLSATPTDGNESLRLGDIKRQTEDTITISPLSVSINLLKQAGVTNVLASPRIRARNHEHAKILIGSRVPVITNTVTPVSTGSPVVTGSVQYLDVGLTLEVEPTVYLDNDVAVKIGLEVSSILKEVPGPNGSLAYQIGTRDTSTMLRLRDGETSILAGLINDQESHNSSHIPGLGDIPVIGRLFGSVRSTNDKTEIVLSITPRIIRAQPRPGSDTTEFWYGTESSMRSAPFGSLGATANAASAAAGAPGSAPESGNALIPQPEATSSVTASVEQPATPPASISMTPSAANLRIPPTIPGAPEISWSAPGEVSVGQTFDVALRMSGGEDLKNVRSQLHYDTSVLALQSAEAGDAIPAELGAAPRINQIAGVLQFVANGTADKPVRGEGGLVVMRFKALAPNPGARVTLQFSAVTASGASMAPASQQPLTIVVAP